MLEPEMIEVEVDGLPVEVEQEKFLLDPEGVADSVRHSRQSLALGEDVEPALDYDAMIEEFGENDG